MKYSFCILSAVLALAFAAPAPNKRGTPHVYLAGDSTMALGGDGSGTQGATSLST
jgi:rhamnogalacturonan acetylesterase